MPSTEAMQYKSRCKKCFECPQCFSTLAFQSSDGGPVSSTAPTLLKAEPPSPVKGTTSTATQPAIPSDPNAKCYFLCGFCRWSSLDMNDLKAETPAQLIAKSLEREKDDSLAKEALKLIETLQKEERERAKEKRSQKLRKASSLPPRMSLGIRLGTDLEKKSIPSLDKSEGPLKTGSILTKVVPVPPKEEPPQDTAPRFAIEKDDTSEYEGSMNINDLTSLPQRFMQMSMQPIHMQNLFPKRKQLLTRRSKHCCRCDKLLVKPDLSPAKIDFKRQHVAFLYIPRVTVAQAPTIKLNDSSFIILKIMNPLLSFMELTISKEENDKQGIEMLFSQVATFAAPKDHDDDEKDPTFKALKQKDDPSIIVERKFNWAKVKLPFKVVKGDVTFSLRFGVKYKSSASGEQSTSFSIRFDVGSITKWVKPEVVAKK